MPWKRVRPETPRKRRFRPLPTGNQSGGFSSSHPASTKTSPSPSKTPFATISYCKVCGLHMAGTVPRCSLPLLLYLLHAWAPEEELLAEYEAMRAFESEELEERAQVMYEESLAAGLCPWVLSSSLPDHAWALAGL